MTERNGIEISLGIAALISVVEQIVVRFVAGKRDRTVSCNGTLRRMVRRRAVEHRAVVDRQRAASDRVSELKRLRTVFAFKGCSRRVLDADERNLSSVYLRRWRSSGRRP